MTQTATTIQDGYYTVAHGTSHKTFRLKTQPADADFAPNKTVIGYLAGAGNESSYVSFAFVIDGRVIPWQRFQSGYEEIIQSARYLVSGPSESHEKAGKMYAMQSGKCYRCNRLLTSPESIAAGLGPVCAKVLLQKFLTHQN